MTSLNLSVGQKVQLNDGRSALVRFKGATSFAPGDWVGVELNEPSGKNDGSVQGERYFECDDNHGMFLRATGITKILEPAKPTAARTAAQRKSMAPPVTKPRPSSVSLAPKPAVQNGRARESMAASPTPARAPANRLSGMRVSSQARHLESYPHKPQSPLTSPTKQLSSANSSSSSRTSTPSTPASKSRPSLAPSSTPARRTSAVPSTRTAPRPSLAGPGARSAVPARGIPPAATPRSLANRLSDASHATLSSRASTEERDTGSEIRSPSSTASHEKRLSTADGSQDARLDTPEQEEREDVDSNSGDIDATPKPVRKQPPPAQSAATSRSSSLQSVSSPVTTSASQRGPVASRSAANATREIEDLQTKLRLLEKRRLEDREKLKALEKIQQERNRFESIIQKLQQKYQPQQQELADLKRQIKESEARFLEIENIQADHDAELENATLDREMAEEQYEAVKSELVVLRERYEEMELEVDVLREENQELTQEMSPEERTSQGWLQLERSNERYREALIRLRDITQEQEAELKQQIAALEKDLDQFSGINEEAESLKVRLLESEAAIEDLKQQLELAQGGEEMLEELSERNMALQERIDDLSAVIEELENLKELNDELEVNHVEAEKQMQEEIDFKDSIINEQLSRSQEQQKSIEDYEMTVARFREAFRNLQADLEDMRASKQITDTEAEDLNSKSRALIDLNMKLQSSAAKTQIKTLDLELQRLEAEEAAQHLSIVRLFLPESYNADRDSVLALLRIKRILFKAELLHNAVKERIDDGRGEDLFAACSVLDRLVWIAATCRRLVNAINECPADDFDRFESALYELEPIERLLNSYLEMVKKGDVSAKKMDLELQRSIAVIGHLGSKLFSKSLPATAADEMILVMSTVQSNLENAASALILTRAYVEAHSRPTAAQDVNGQTSEYEDEDESEETEPSFGPFYERIDSIISQTRSAKVLAIKTNKELSDLRARLLALQPSHRDDFLVAQAAAYTIVSFATSLGDNITTLLDPSDSSKPLTPHRVVPVLISTASRSFSLSTAESSPLTTLHTRLTALTSSLTDLYSLSTSLPQTIELPASSPPWLQRSQALKSASLAPSTAEAEIARLNDVLAERNVQLRTRERDLDDHAVRVEMLEARMRDAAKRSARIEELEGLVDAAKADAKRWKDELERVKVEAGRLRKERDEARVAVRAQGEREGEKAQGEGEGVGRAGRVELERRALELSRLRGVVRALQRGSGGVKLLDDDAAWLNAPLALHRPDSAADVRRDASDVLLGLVGLAAEARMVDLGAPQGKDRLAWRPARETGAWIVGRQREEWERWREESRGVVARVEAWERTRR